MDTKILSMESIIEQCTELEKNIIQMYMERHTQKNICTTLNIKRGYIDSLVKKYALNRFRDRKSSFCKKVDPKDPNFWYFFGLFASDGNLYFKSKAVDTIQFTLDDKEALEDIKKILECNNEIRKYKRGNKFRWYLSISDSILIKTVRSILKNDGYRKTFTLEFPEVPNSNCLIMFLRGYFDGDGSYAASPITGFYNFKIYCASKSFIHTLYKTLTNIVGEKVHLYKNSYIEINAQRSVYLLLKYLYSYNPNIGIKRKRDRAMQHIRNYELKI